MEFFRFCPECGRRFHIKLVSKQLVHTERQEHRRKHVIRMGITPGLGARATIQQTPITMVQEGKPVFVNIEEFQYSYKCKHCGHEWTEKHIEKRREN